MRLAALLLLIPVAGAAEAADSEFLFDILHKPAFRASWERLLKSVQPTPDWLRQFNSNYDGVAGQAVQVTLNGKAYTQSFVCKPQDCDGHKFVVLFDAAGARAVGALGGKDNSPAFFGAPTPAEETALSNAVKG